MLLNQIKFTTFVTVATLLQLLKLIIMNIQEKVQGTKAVETTLKTIEVQTRLSEEIAQNAVTRAQEKQVKEETIEIIADNIGKSIEELSEDFYIQVEHKTEFNKDFAKNESEYKGIFTLFNILSKGKSSNSINGAFYTHKLNKKYKFGKDYNGLFMLAYVNTLDLIGQVRTPQKFTTSQFKKAFKTFNANCTSFEAFEKALIRSNEINTLIGDYKDSVLSAKGFFEGLEVINKRSFDEKESLKIASYIYSVQAKKDAKEEASKKK